MAVTNNPNSLQCNKQLTLVYLVADIPTHSADFLLKLLTISAGIYNQTLESTIANVSISGTADFSLDCSGILSVIPTVTLSGSSIESNNLDFRATIRPTAMQAGADRSVNLDGALNLNRFITISATATIESVNTLDSTLYLVPVNFGLYGTGSSATVNVALNNTIILNLRTKAHSTYDSTTLNAYATLPILTFGSYKNKNVSDAFIHGRSTGTMEFILNNGEVSKRTYVVNYKQDEQVNLKNKKVKLAKGLVATNWQPELKTVDGTFTEIRGIDLFVSELKRHV